MAWNKLFNRAPYGGAGEDFKDFDVKNINSEQMNALRNDIYGGFKKRDVPRYEMRGAGDGRGSRQTGYSSVNDYNYYKQHVGWAAIADKVGIQNINSENDIRQLYDFANNYRSSPPTAQPSYGNAPSSQGSSSINFEKQLSAIKQDNQNRIDQLTKKLDDQAADYATREADANKRISNLSSTVANAQSMYDPTKGMGSSNNINPALSIQEQSKKLSSGTQRYNRNKLSINNLNL